MKKLSYFISATAFTLFATMVQATTDVSVPIKANGVLGMHIEGGCDNKGPDITLGPSLTLAPIDAYVVFDGGGKHDKEVKKTVALALNFGGEIILPKQGAAPDGVTGNPKISVELADGTVLFGPVRCNKL